MFFPCCCFYVEVITNVQTTFVVQQTNLLLQGHRPMQKELATIFCQPLVLGGRQIMTYHKLYDETPHRGLQLCNEQDQ